MVMKLSTGLLLTSGPVDCIEEDTEVTLAFPTKVKLPDFVIVTGTSCNFPDSLCDPCRVSATLLPPTERPMCYGEIEVTAKPSGATSNQGFFFFFLYFLYFSLYMYMKVIVC